jgi:hypothetical protein
MKSERSDIDIVIPWVDGSDPEWQAAFRAAQNSAAQNSAAQNSEAQNSAAENYAVATGGSENASEIRYRDPGTLRYLLRGIERFAPWARRIHLVTCGHLPDWLQTEHPHLNIVRHVDYIPAEYLPTFSSSPIELNVHRIKGLADRFILFNDDTFLLRPVPPDRFFRGGLPCDMARLSLIAPSSISHTVLNMTEILNRRHSRRETMRRHLCKWYSPRYGAINLLKTLDLSLWRNFAGLADIHMMQPYLRQTFERMWAEERDILDATCREKFRSPFGVNHWLMRYEQLATGRFAPVSVRDARLDELAESRLGDIESYIRRQKYAMICLNDSPSLHDFEAAGRRLVAAFETILPDKSSYER